MHDYQAQKPFELGVYEDIQHLSNSRSWLTVSDIPSKSLISWGLLCPHVLIKAMQSLDHLYMSHVTTAN
jgi:hypothetical protein